MCASTSGYAERGISHAPLCYVPAMNQGTVRIILENVISSPANVNLLDFDEAIRWVEGRDTIRQLNKGTDGRVYRSQFETAAIEMRVLRRLLNRAS